MGPWVGTVLKRASSTAKSCKWKH